MQTASQPEFENWHFNLIGNWILYVFFSGLLSFAAALLLLSAKWENLSQIQQKQRQENKIEWKNNNNKKKEKRTTIYTWASERESFVRSWKYGACTSTRWSDIYATCYPRFNAQKGVMFTIYQHKSTISTIVNVQQRTKLTLQFAHAKKVIFDIHHSEMVQSKPNLLLEHSQSMLRNIRSIIRKEKH